MFVSDLEHTKHILIYKWKINSEVIPYLQPIQNNDSEKPEIEKTEKMEKAQEMLNEELAHLEEVNRTQVYYQATGYTTQYRYDPINTGGYSGQTAFDTRYRLGYKCWTISMPTYGP